MIPMYNTVNFSDVFKDLDSFKEGLQFFDEMVPVAPAITEGSKALTYFILYARYANSPIATSDVNQFKAKVWSTVIQYGPSWEKKLEIQKKLRELRDDELRMGVRNITNMALNPDQAPTTEEVAYVNSQNVNKSTKSILGAYSELWDLIENDVTEEYINRFKNLFKKVVIPEKTHIFRTEVEE